MFRTCWGLVALVSSAAYAGALPPPSGPVGVPMHEQRNLRVREVKALRFVEDELDFGTIEDNETVTLVYEFKNTGDTDVIIRNVRTSCGCTTSKLDKKLYAPGESGEIIAEFDSKNRAGLQRKTITVSTTEGDQTKIYRLNLTGSVRPLVRLQPSTFNLGRLEKGQAGSRKISLTSRDPSIEILGIDYDTPGIATLEVLGRRTLQSIEGEDVTVIDLEARTDGIDMAGSFSVGVTIRTNIERKPKIKANISGVVLSDLVPTSPVINLGELPVGAEFRADMTLVHRNGEPFNIVSWEYEGEEMNIDVSHAPLTEDTEGGQSGHSLVIVGAPVRPARIFRDTLVITTDLEDEPPVILTFRALVKAGPGVRPTGG